MNLKAMSLALFLAITPIKIPENPNTLSTSVDSAKYDSSFSVDSDSIESVSSAKYRYFEYKIRFPFIRGNFTYEEVCNNSLENKKDISSKIELGGIIKSIRKEYNSHTIDNKVIYEEDEEKYELETNPIKRDFLGIISSFMEYAEGDSVEKHPLFRNEDNSEPFTIFIDGVWRTLKSVSPEKVRIKYKDENIEATHVPLYSEDFPTKFDLYIYDKKIVKIRIKLKLGISVWAELIKDNR